MDPRHSERVTLETTDGVADVRLVRADKHNALDSEMFEAIHAAIDELEAADGLRVAVLSGEGPSFCSGLDFGGFLNEDADPDAIFGRREGEVGNYVQRLSYGWAELDVPVIAALHGACFGGGLQIALGADIRIAAPDTKLSVMEMKYGLIPDMGITAAIRDLVRVDVARELTYTARIVEAAEALELGLLTRIADDPVAEARELAGEIGSKSPDAIRSAKRLWREAPRGSVADGLTLEAELQRKLLESLREAAPG